MMLLGLGFVLNYQHINLLGSGLRVCIKLSIFEFDLIYFILLVNYKFGEIWVSLKSIDKFVYLGIRDLSLSLAYTKSIFIKNAKCYKC